MKVRHFVFTTSEYLISCIPSPKNDLSEQMVLTVRDSVQKLNSACEELSVKSFEV